MFTPASDWAATVASERERNLDWSQRSHPLVPVIRGLHLHERPIAMERPIKTAHTSQAGLNGVVTSSAAYMRVEVRLG